ncbi:MAG: hypothetical protein MK133_14160 [Planctomycetes bacterium]|nr:hypothetical protein [Planctomycetota bacterium]
MEALHELGYHCAAAIGVVQPRGKLPESVYLTPGD